MDKITTALSPYLPEHHIATILASSIFDVYINSSTSSPLFFCQQPFEFSLQKSLDFALVHSDCYFVLPTKLQNLALILKQISQVSPHFQLLNKASQDLQNSNFLTPFFDDLTFENLDDYKFKISKLQNIDIGIICVENQNLIQFSKGAIHIYTQQLSSLCQSWQRAGTVFKNGKALLKSIVLNSKVQKTQVTAQEILMMEIYNFQLFENVVFAIQNKHAQELFKILQQLNFPHKLQHQIFIAFYMNLVYQFFEDFSIQKTEKPILNQIHVCENLLAINSAGQAIQKVFGDFDAAKLLLQAAAENDIQISEFEQLISQFEIVKTQFLEIAGCSCQLISQKNIVVNQFFQQKNVITVLQNFDKQVIQRLQTNEIDLISNYQKLVKLQNLTIRRPDLQLIFKQKMGEIAKKISLFRGRVEVDITTTYIEHQNNSNELIQLLKYYKKPDKLLAFNGMFKARIIDFLQFCITSQDRMNLLQKLVKEQTNDTQLMEYVMLMNSHYCSAERAFKLFFTGQLKDFVLDQNIYQKGLKSQIIFANCKIVQEYFECCIFMKHNIVKGLITGQLSDFNLPFSVKIIQEIYFQVTKTSSLINNFNVLYSQLKQQIADFQLQKLTFKGKIEFLSPLLDIVNQIFKLLLLVPYGGVANGNEIQILYYTEITQSTTFLPFHKIFLDFNQVDTCNFILDGNLVNFSIVSSKIIAKLQSLQAHIQYFQHSFSSMQSHIKLLDQHVLQLFSCESSKIQSIYDQSTDLVCQIFQKNQDQSIKFLNQTFQEFLMIRLYFSFCYLIKFYQMEDENNEIFEVELKYFQEFLPILQKYSKKQVDTLVNSVQQEFVARICVISGEIQICPTEQNLLASLLNLVQNLTFSALNLVVQSNIQCDLQNITLYEYFLKNQCSQTEISAKICEIIQVFQKKAVNLVKKLQEFLLSERNSSILLDNNIQNQLIQHCNNDQKILLELYIALAQSKNLNISGHLNSNFGIISIQFDKSFSENIQNSISSFSQTIQNLIINGIQDTLKAHLLSVKSSLSELSQYDENYIKNLLAGTAFNEQVQRLFINGEKADSVIQIIQESGEFYEQLFENLTSIDIKDKITDLLQQYALLKQIKNQFNKVLESSNGISGVKNHIFGHAKIISLEVYNLSNKWQKLIIFDQLNNIFSFVSVTKDAIDINNQTKSFIDKITRLMPQLKAVHKTDQVMYKKLENEEVQLQQIFKESFNYINQIFPLCSQIYSEIYKLEKKQLTDVDNSILFTIIDNFRTDVNKLSPDLNIYKLVYQNIDTIIKVLTLVEPLFEKNLMTENLWQELLKNLNIKTKKLNCSQFITHIMNADKQGELVLEQILTKAHGQYFVKKFIQEIQESWENTNFKFSTKDDISLILNWNELHVKIEQDLATIQGLTSNPYFNDFQTIILYWIGVIERLQEISQIWQSSQKHFVYLRSIIGNNLSILSQYVSIDNFISAQDLFLQILLEHNNEKNILHILDSDQLHSNLKHINQQFENILQSLNIFLEKQRYITPQLFFISDQDLIDMITQTQNGNYINMNKHWNKIYQGISAIEINEAQMVVNFQSREGEIVETFVKQSTINNQNSDSLVLHYIISILDKTVQQTLKYNLFISLQKLSILLLNDIKKDDLINIIQDSPIQIICLAFSVFTGFISTQSNNIFTNKQLKDKLLQIQQILSQHNTFSKPFIKQIVISELEYHIQLLSAGQDLLNDKFTQLLTLKHVMHYNDIKSPFQLQKLEFNENYLSVYVQVGYSIKLYGFTYHGSSQRIIQTQLTSYAYYIGSFAMSQKIGCAPIGKAGSGKTETVKQLAVQLGQPYIVFNTSSSFSIQAICRILCGICGSGYILCFDEFNRLESNVLSAVAGYIEFIITAQRSNQKNITINGSNIILNSNSSIFVTMNPNYIGRNTLPENLKCLMNNIIMDQPDIQIISSVLLSSLGFKEAQKLSYQIIEIFELCLEDLSCQIHYDWGLRAIKSLILLAGKILFNKYQAQETLCILCAAFSIIEPKLVQNDIIPFKNIISKIFKIQDSPIIDNKFNEAIKSSMNTLNLYGQDILLKTSHLQQAQQFSSGVMLIGKTATGKTASFNCYIKAFNIILSEQYQQQGVYTQVYSINVKQFESNDQIFGYLHEYTMEWTDGIYTKIIRQAIDENYNSQCPKHHFIYFDTYLSSDWIESLNSVLDDNKSLTLPNGEVINIPNYVHHIFESNDLANITPASISRCAIIWYSASPNSHDQFVNFIQNTNKQYQQVKTQNQRLLNITIDVFLKLANHYQQKLNLLQNFIEQSAKQQFLIMDLQFQSQLQTFFALMESIFNDLNDHYQNKNQLEDQMLIISNFVMEKFVWSIMVAFSTQFEQKQYICQKLQQYFEFSQNLPKSYYLYPVIGQEHWISNNLYKTKLILKQQEQQIISTIDTQTYLHYINSLIYTNRFIIFCGPAGSGKSMLLEHAIRSLALVQSFALSFSQTSTPSMLIQKIISQCQIIEKQNYWLLLPKNPNKKLIFIIDELNLPSQDQYNCQKVIELLRLLIEYNRFYYNSQYYQLQNITFVSSCNPPQDANRYILDQRFLSKTTIIYCDYPQTESLHTIYQTYLSQLFTDSSLVQIQVIFSNIMVQFYNYIKDNYTKDLHSHYIYSPRDLTRWFIGIKSLYIPSIISISRLIGILYFEGCRVFSDKIVKLQDKLVIQQQLQNIISSSFPEQSEEIFNQLYTYFDQGKLQEYSISTLYQQIQKQYKVYYQESKLRNPYLKAIYLTDQHLNLVLKIDRVLRQPLGHLIIASKSGYGKQETCKFVAWNLNMEVITMQSHSQFSQNDFEEVLKDLIIKSGIYNQKIVFYLSQSNNLSLSFLELTNSILASGDFYGLFSGESLSHLIGLGHEQYLKQSQHTIKTDDNIIQDIINRVKINLHFIFSYTSNLQSMSPAILNRCTILFDDDWSINSYIEVSQFLLKQKLGYDIIKAQISVIDNIPKIIIKLTLHQKVPFILSLLHIRLSQLFIKSNIKFYISPRQFLQVINLFCMKLTQFETKLQEKQNHTNAGLKILEETQNQINQLKIQLQEQQNEILLKKKLADKKLQLTIEKQANVTNRQKDLNVILDKISQKQSEIELKKEPIKQELEDVQPALEKAKAHIKGINKPQLDELKSLAKPSITIRLAMEAVILIISEKADQEDLSWNNIRILMKKDDFMQKLLKYDPLQHVLTDKLIRKLRDNYLNNPVISVEIVTRSSRAAGPMYSWVVSVYNFLQIAISFKPLLLEIQKIEKEADVIQQELLLYEKDVEKLQLDQKQYEEDYKTLLQNLSSLEITKEDTVKKYNKAIDLVSQFDSEKERWKSQSNFLQQQLTNNVGNILILSFGIVYLVQVEEEIKTLAIREIKIWLEQTNIKFTNQFEIYENICTNKDNLDQIIEKCSFNNDMVSKFNIASILALNTQPNQINQFISSIIVYNLFSVADISLKLNIVFNLEATITSQQSTDYLIQVERALRFGKILIIEDIVQYDALFNQLINYQIKFNNSSKNLKIETITLIDKQIEINNNFKVIFVVNNIETFPVNTIQKCHILNFQETLLSNIQHQKDLIMSFDQPQLRINIKNNILTQNTLASQLLILELKLLSTISNSSSSELLENSSILNILKQTKAEFCEIENQKNESDALLKTSKMLLNIYLKTAKFISEIFKLFEYFSEFFSIFKIQKQTFYAIIDEAKSVFTTPVVESDILSQFTRKFTEILYKTAICSLSNKEKLAFSIAFLGFVIQESEYSDIFGLSKCDILTQQTHENVIVQEFLTMKDNKSIQLLDKVSTIISNLLQFKIPVNEFSLEKLIYRYQNNTFLLVSEGQINPETAIPLSFSETVEKLQFGNQNCNLEYIKQIQQPVIIQNFHLASQSEQQKFQKACSSKSQNSIFTAQNKNLSQYIINNCFVFRVESKQNFDLTYKETIQFLTKELDQSSLLIQTIAAAHSSIVLRQNYAPIGLRKDYGFGVFELSQIVIILKNQNLQLDIDFSLLQNLILYTCYLNRAETPEDKLILTHIIRNFVCVKVQTEQKINSIGFDFHDSHISGTLLLPSAEEFAGQELVSDALNIAENIILRQGKSNQNVIIKNKNLVQSINISPFEIQFSSQIPHQNTLKTFRSMKNFASGDRLIFGFQKTDISVLGVRFMFCKFSGKLEIFDDKSYNEIMVYARIEKNDKILENKSVGLPVYQNISRKDIAFYINVDGAEDFIVQGACGVLE
ncbi:Dynein heavy chain [Spironucleus salmonicida]|uniref:Dynein heavy chain n=1 Tax=Spironucleus salmonicida TaxID=348837 RepID=V6LMN2_9EUKA|nr:Dynein heavy chain [Spironucleus salmonicida]|eukprot:EST41979.1 Dynein heavy chain [Spironucleus salmonicida]